MSVSPRQFVLALAAVVLALGVWGLLWPVSVAGPESDSLRCGDGGIALSEPVTSRHFQGGILAYDDYGSGKLIEAESLVSNAGPTYYAAPWQAKCAEALAARSLWVWPATVIGAVALLGALVIRQSRATI